MWVYLERAPKEPCSIRQSQSAIDHIYAQLFTSSLSSCLAANGLGQFVTNLSSERASVLFPPPSMLAIVNPNIKASSSDCGIPSALATVDLVHPPSRNAASILGNTCEVSRGIGFGSRVRYLFFEI